MSDVEKLRKDMLTVAKAFGDREGNEAYPLDHMTAKSALEIFADRLEKINAGLSLVPSVRGDSLRKEVADVIAKNPPRATCDFDPQADEQHYLSVADQILALVPSECVSDLQQGLIAIHIASRRRSEREGLTEQQHLEFARHTAERAKQALVLAGLWPKRNTSRLVGSALPAPEEA